MNAALMKPLATALILAGFTIGLIPLQPVAQAADEQGTNNTPQQIISPLSSELFTQYLKGLKKTPEYALARAYDPKQVREQVSKWGYELRLVQSKRFSEWNVQVRSIVVKLPDGSARLRQKPGQSVVLEVTREGASPSLYALSASQLDDETLAFKTVYRMNVLEPSLVPMERFTVENQSLADIVSLLCRRGNLDYSFREDLARPIRLTMDLRAKSIPDCLAMISRTTSWTVMYMYNRGFFDKITVGFGVPVLGNGRIEPGADPMDVLEQAFEKAMLPSQRPTVILTAPKEAHQEKQTRGKPAARGKKNE